MHQAMYPVRTMCRVLGVSSSGYYAWRARPQSARARANELLLDRIHAISYETYGSPRIHAELQDEGESVGLNRVSRLMRRGGLVGVTRRRKWRTTKRDKDARPAPDLVQRDFAAEGPDQLWVADIICANGERVLVRSGRRGRVEPSSGRLVDAEPPEDGSGPPGAGHGAPPV